MAIFEKTIRNKNFDKLLRKLENEIPGQQLVGRFRGRQ